MVLEDGPCRAQLLIVAGEGKGGVGPRVRPTVLPPGCVKVVPPAARAAARAVETNADGIRQLAGDLRRAQPLPDQRLGLVHLIAADESAQILAVRLCGFRVALDPRVEIFGQLAVASLVLEELGVKLAKRILFVGLPLC